MSNSKEHSGINMHISDDKVSMLFFMFLFLLFAVVSMTKNCFSSALAAIVSEGIMKKSQTGLITSAFYIVYGPLQIVGGMLVDRYNPERLVKIGLAGSAVANTIIFLNHNYYVMLCAWIFNGIAQMALYPGLFKIITSQLSPGWQKKGLYYFSFAAIFGLMLGYMTAAFVTKWEYNFLLSAVVTYVLLASLHIIYKHVLKYMVPDAAPKTVMKQEGKIEKISTVKLFAISGFFLMLPVWLLRYMVDNSIKTFTPTMMVESYPNMSIMVSNLLNIFIIISGLLGIIIVRKFIFPRRIRNEVATVILLTALTLPLTFVIKNTGKIDVWFIVAAMCMVSFLLSGASLMTSFINGSFSKYGKNGTAAGLSNSANSIGIVVQSYGFTYLADHSGWGAVTTLYVVGILACVFFSLCALPLWRKYKNQ